KFMMSLSDTAILQTVLFDVFVVGVVLGLIVSGFFKTLLNSLIYRFERPKRIKTQDGFLYFFKGKYYPLEYRNKLIDEHRKKFKHLSL
ncbi:hypothetical protein WAI05_19575, partial [Acinetobacter baumannii]